ncbi:MAG: peptidoglycan editing factor PgeF [Pseudomonadota bacterium]
MDLNPLTSDLLDGTAHGFFTRRGGVSTGMYAGLNTGEGSADRAEDVVENRRRVAERLGAAHLISVHQIHSDVAVRVERPWVEKPEADAMVTTTPGLALGVLSADCAPVLLADREAGVIGAAHAGWKGAIGGVLEAVVAAMQAMGANRLRAAIGPCISQRAYEVGPEFAERFIDEDHEYARFFAQGEGDRMQFDLPGFALMRLRAAGVEAEWTGHCTFSDEVRFFSYRRTCHRGEPDYGRLVSAITL